MKKLMIIGLLVFALTAALTGTANAAKETFTLDCSTSGTVVVETSNGNWSVARVVDNGTHFIPFAIKFVVTDAGGNVVFSETMAKKGHQNQEPKETCTFEGTVTEGGETFTIKGQAEVIRRP